MDWMAAGRYILWSTSGDNTNHLARGMQQTLNVFFCVINLKNNVSIVKNNLWCFKMVKNGTQ